jgi:WD40 repeat protein
MISSFEIKSKNATSIEQIAFSPDGNFIAIGQQGISKDLPNLSLWELSNLNNPKTIDSEDNYHFITGLTFVRNGQSLFYAKDDSYAWEYNLSTSTKTQVPILSISTRGMRTSKTKNFVAIYGFQQFVYDFVTEKLIWLNDYEIDMNLGDICPVVISQDSESFCFFDQKTSSLKFLSLETLELLNVIPDVPSQILDLALSPDNKYVAVLSRPDRELYIWSIEKKTKIQFSQLPEDFLLSGNSMAFHPSKNFLFLGANRGSLYAINLDKKEFLDFNIWDKDIVVSSFSPDGNLFVVGGRYGDLKAMDLDLLDLQINNNNW